MERKYNKALVTPAKILRKNMIREERRLRYDFLRNHPVRFSRQKILGKYIADFYCAQAKLVIELDGSQHFDEDGLSYDAKRDAFLQGYDITVLRSPNNEVNHNFQGVCEHIDQLVQQSLSQLR